MNVNFEYAKTLAGEGAILLLLSMVPYAGWILGIIGVVLFLRGMKELSNYYQDTELYQNALTGVKFYIVAIIAAAVAITALMIGIWSATGFVADTFHLTAGFGVGILAFLGGLITAFIFYIFATLHLKRTFHSLAQKSGEASFYTAGTLLWVGALTTIILVGLVLILIGWIFATIGFFTMKSKQQQTYQQPYGYGPVPAQQPTYQTPPQAATQNNSQAQRSVQGGAFNAAQNRSAS
jgi:uncharacterized membrane protein